MRTILIIGVCLFCIWPAYSNPTAEGASLSTERTTGVVVTILEDRLQNIPAETLWDKFIELIDGK